MKALAILIILMGDESKKSTEKKAHKTQTAVTVSG